VGVINELEVSYLEYNECHKHYLPIVLGLATSRTLISHVTKHAHYCYGKNIDMNQVFIHPIFNEKFLDQYISSFFNITM